MPVGKILSMCKDDDIASADERCNIRQPFLGIRLDRLDRFVADTDMAPGMACDCPAVCVDRLGYFFSQSKSGCASSHAT